MAILQVVVPIGVGAEGTPVQKYFEEGIESLLSQSVPVDVWIAADSNVPDRIKEFIEKKNLNVKWFDPFFFYRKGSIWKKIFDTWKESDSEYVAFMHYDDVWEIDKALLQTETMTRESLEASWSEVYVIGESSEIKSGDVAHFQRLDIDNWNSRTVAFAHSTIVRRDSIFSSGILEHENDWAATFEDIWILYLRTFQNAHKVTGALFFWRDHSMSLTQTGREEAKFVQEQRAVTNYTLSETFSDSDKMNKTLERVKSKILKKYNT